MTRQAESDLVERQAIPRVQHLGYFDAALYGIQGGMTFDELRLQLSRVARDLARFEGRFVAPQRTSPHYFWRTTRDTLQGLMQGGFVGTQALPSTKATVSNHAGTKYALSPSGKSLLHLNVGEQREELAHALYRTYPAVRRYLTRLAKGPLLIPEFTEADLVDMGAVSGDWSSLAEETVNRVIKAVGSQVETGRCAPAIQDFVKKRFHRRSNYSRKELLDAVNDAVAKFIAHEEGIIVDATSLGVIHEWSRQLFLTGSSRYVHGMPGGLLHWSASTVSEGANMVVRRRTIPHVLPEATAAIARAYRALRREETSMVEYYAVRATAAYMAHVANDVIDKIVAAMVSGKIPDKLGVQPSAGAQWSPPPSERPLRISGRRYTLISIQHFKEED